MRIRKAVAVVAGVGIALGVVTRIISRPTSKAPSKQGATMGKEEKNVQVMLEIFRAIEERDPNREDVQRELALVQPDVEFYWPPALPYGGTFRGATRRSRDTWGSTWTPLQPTPTERRMDPRVVGVNGDEVAILYHQRGVSPNGERFDGEVLGLYELLDFKLARAQMFYFDEAAACRFLARASRRGDR
jgi:ketosteroid isomerase-like protein